MTNTEPVAGQQGTDIDSLNNNSKSGRGGARRGAGRPKGAMDKSTKERLAIRKRFEDRIHHNADVLLNAALNKALGETYLMRKVTERDSKDKVLRVYHEVVTDQQTIIDYLDGELEGNDSINDNDPDSYYYMSTKPVDMVAVKELYDRAFGKPLQKNELSGKDGEPLSLGLTPEQADQLLKLRAAQVEPNAN
jgi:hypothetical protein